MYLSEVWRTVRGNYSWYFESDIDFKQMEIRMSSDSREEGLTKKGGPVGDRKIFTYNLFEPYFAHWFATAQHSLVSIKELQEHAKKNIKDHEDK